MCITGIEAAVGCLHLVMLVCALSVLTVFMAAYGTTDHLQGQSCIVTYDDRMVTFKSPAAPQQGKPHWTCGPANMSVGPALHPQI